MFMQSPGVEAVPAGGVGDFLARGIHDIGYYMKKYKPRGAEQRTHGNNCSFVVAVTCFSITFCPPPGRLYVNIESSLKDSVLLYVKPFVMSQSNSPDKDATKFAEPPP